MKHYYTEEDRVEMIRMAADELDALMGDPDFIAYLNKMEQEEQDAKGYRIAIKYGFPM